MEQVNNKFILSWAEAFKVGAESAGGKGWNLGRLDRYGFNVPPGGVITVNAYELFLLENNLQHNFDRLTEEINVANIAEKETEEKLALVRESIISGTFPHNVVEEINAGLKALGLLSKPVAVRSSASLEDSDQTSFAGIHDSFLCVNGEEQIMDAVKKCYASLWTPRAVSYRRRLNISDNDLAQALVVMGMVEARSAGIGFTCDPRTGRYDTMIINANYGLGESVVGGQVEPDEYTLDTRSLLPRISDKQMGKKEGMTVPDESCGTKFVTAGPAGSSDQEVSQSGHVLSDEEIIHLGLLMQMVYESLGGGYRHQDIEWAFDGEKFYMLQARPVTSMPKYTYPVLKTQPDLWSNANIRDALPMVQSTLNVKIVSTLFETIVLALFHAVGYRVLPGLHYYRLFQGRGYLNISLMQWEYLDAFGISPSELNEASGGHQPEITIPDSARQGGSANSKRNWRKLKLGLALTRVQKEADHHFAIVRNFTRGWVNRDLTSLGSRDLLASIEDIQSRAIEYAPVMGMLTTSMAFPWTMLLATLKKSFPGRENAVANALLLGQGNIVSAEHGYRLLELAETARADAPAAEFFASKPFQPRDWESKLPDNSSFKQGFSRFLDEFGHRAVYEGDIINPRWREEPAYLLDVIRSLLTSTDHTKTKARQQEKRKGHWQELSKISWLRRKMINWWAGKALKGAEMREMAKSELARFAEPIRLVALEIGRRLEETNILNKREDVFHCSWPELILILDEKWDGRGLKALVQERKVTRTLLENLAPPDVIVGETPRHAGGNRIASGRVLKGIGVATGRASGRARLISHPGEGERLNHGEILVAPSTDPGWTPLFLRAGGLVMETGGSLSHGSVVAREYGIPAVVNIPGVMKVLRNDQIITVNGDEGQVHL